MRSDLRHILHPNDSPSSSSSSPHVSIPPISTSQNAQNAQNTTSLSSTSPSATSRHFAGPHASDSPNFAPTTTSASASTTSDSSFGVCNYSNDARSRPEPPRLNHHRPSPNYHCTPNSSKSSIIQDAADFKTFEFRNSFQSPTHSSISSTRCPSTSRDSSGNTGTNHPNISDQSTTCSTTNGKSSVQPTSTPTTPPSPSPSPIQQSGIAKSPAPNYQSIATQTSFEFAMHSSPRPQPQERPTSSQAGTHFPTATGTPPQIYPSPHAEPSSGQQSPSHPSSRSNTMHPVDRSSSLGLESVEVAPANIKISDLVEPNVSNSSSDHPCEMCIAQVQAHKDQLHLPREPPPNMAESQRKMGEFSELVRTMKMRCERHRHQRTSPAARDVGDEVLHARKRKEPSDTSSGAERHVKTARFSSGSPPLETPSIRGTNASSLPTSFDSGKYGRRSNDSSIPEHLIGDDVATILNLPGSAHRQYEPPRTDWQNMWQDLEHERRKEKKNRKDSVPVLSSTSDAVEVAPQ